MTAAAELAKAGCRVDVFDKARGPGGRMSVRRADVDGVGPIAFPHGATFFDVEGTDFAEAVHEWEGEGLVTPYDGRVVTWISGTIFPAEPAPRYVGTPAMNSVAKHLAETPGITFHPRKRVVELGEALRFDDGTTADGHELTILAVPSPQAAELLAGDHPDLAAIARAAVMRPTWAAMLAWPDADDEAAFDAARVESSPVTWLFRAGPGAWVAHLSHDWSDQFLEAQPSEVAAEASRHVAVLLGRSGPPVHAAAHRWRYAGTAAPAGRSTLSTPDERLIVCGDWLLGDGVPDAWRSGRAAAALALEGSRRPRDLAPAG